MSNWLQVIAEGLRIRIVELFKWIQRHPFWLHRYFHLLFIVFLFIYLISPRFTPRTVQFLSAPIGGEGHMLAQNLSDRINRKSNWESWTNWRVPLKLTPTPTDGFEYNRRRIREDGEKREGRNVAFSHDGFHPCDEVQVLLPLELNCLHIIIRKEFYELAKGASKPASSTSDAPATSNSFEEKAGIGVEDAPATSAAPAFLNSLAEIRGIGGENAPPTSDTPATGSKNQRSLSQVYRFLYPAIDKSEYDGQDFVSLPQWTALVEGRVFLGRKLSGTRQVAELVLQHYGIPDSVIASISCEEELDWNEMGKRLETGNLNMAFMLVTPGSVSVLHKLAKSGNFYLLGCDHAEAIHRLNPHIKVDALPVFSYGYPLDPAKSEEDGFFCSSEINVVATRRVIIASSSMSTNDAFFLAGYLRDALESMSTPIRWDIPPQRQQEEIAPELVYAIHPGARYLQRNRIPWAQTFLSWLWAFIGSILAYLILAILASLFRSPSSETDTAELVSAQEDEVAHRGALKELIDDIAAKIDDCCRTPQPMDAPDFRRWQTIYRDLKRKCVQQARTHGFNDDEKELLRKGLSELDWEIEESRPVTQPHRQQAVT